MAVMMLAVHAAAVMAEVDVIKILHFFLHRWTNWETLEQGEAKYVFTGGSCTYVTQQRTCKQCNKIELRTVTS